MLVLASDDVENTFYINKKICNAWKPLYPHFKQVYEEYMNENPNIKVLFVYGNSPNLIAKPHDLMYDVFENDYPGMITKTLYAMQTIENTYDYDFLIRTNLSTFWDLTKLGDRLNTLPTKHCLTGTYQKLRYKDGKDYHFFAGYDMIISRDIIQKILPHVDEIIEQKVPFNLEDLSMCSSVEKYTDICIPSLSNASHVIYVNMDEFSEKEFQRIFFNIYSKTKADHFRIRTRVNRNVDKLIHEKLLWEIYGKKLL